MNEHHMIFVLGIVFFISIFIACLTKYWEKINSIESTPEQQCHDSVQGIRESSFPFVWWLISSILGYIFSWLITFNDLHFGEQSNSLSAIFMAVAALLTSGIPMWIAWRRNLKRRKIVYTLAGMGVCLPGGILLCIISLMWALIGRRNK